MLDGAQEAEQNIGNSRTCAVTNLDQTSASEMCMSLEMNPNPYCTWRTWASKDGSTPLPHDTQNRYVYGKPRSLTRDGMKGERKMFLTFSLELAPPLSSNSSCIAAPWRWISVCAWWPSSCDETAYCPEHEWITSLVIILQVLSPPMDFAYTLCTVC
jgi:hypothetical protein